MGYEKYFDIDGVRERFMGNEALYKKFLFRFPGENRIEELRKYIVEQNIDDAFFVAHTMKGVASNLSLELVVQFLNPVVETLRKKELPGESQIELLTQACRETEEAIREIEEMGASLF